MIERSISKFFLPLAFVLTFGGTILFAQEQTPTSRENAPAEHKDGYIQVDIGAVTPTGQTKSSGGYKSSFMIGGGFGVPITKWISWDLADVDFGFGTTNQTQTIQVSNGTTATTENYQILFGDGARANVPLRHGYILGLGGGVASAVQNEYVPDQYSTIGGVTTITSVNCTTCSHRSFTGAYVEGRLFGRSDKYNGAGIDAKYYMLNSDSSSSSYTNLPAQRWLTVGFVVTFGI